MKRLLLSYKTIIFAIAILFSINEIKAQSNFKIFHEQLRYTCSNRNNAEVRVWASDDSCAYNVDTTYKYKWLSSDIKPTQLSDNNQHVIGLRAYTKYVLKVTKKQSANDSIVQTDTIILKAFLTPNIEISSDPSDTVYLDNPNVTWSFANNKFQYKYPNGTLVDTTIEVINPRWQFEDHEDSYTSMKPTVSYGSTGSKYTKLTVTNDNDSGCDTTFTTSIEVVPVELKIPNIFTPNGDGCNDYFEIGYKNGHPINDLNVYFLSHKLVIFNRWGRIVYESTNYQNDWDGGNLPDGTYFYVLDCKGETKNYRYQGSVMIWNSGR